VEQGPAVADRTPIFALLGANAISQVGNMMTTVAVPWFVLQTTGSAAKTGLTAAAIGVGPVLPSILVGPLVDRLGFKRTSVLADLASGATVAAIPLLTAFRAALSSYKGSDVGTSKGIVSFPRSKLEVCRHPAKSFEILLFLYWTRRQRCVSYSSRTWWVLRREYVRLGRTKYRISKASRPATTTSVASSLGKATTRPAVSM
jgi:MFS family permease